SLRLLRKVRRRARLLLRGESPRHFFDLADRDPLNHLLAEAGLPPLDSTPRELAVRDGDPERGEKVYELREDVRRAIPLALTPAQRGAYLRWFLVAGGRRETDATLADLLRALFDLDATPDRGLVASYLVQPAWQECFPHALTPAGWPPFKDGIAAEYGVGGRWLRRAALPAKYQTTSAATPGVNVIGLFRYTSGLQQAANSLVDGLGVAGIPVELRDVPMSHHRDGRPRAGFDGLERHGITILNTGLDMPVPEAYRLAGLHRRSDVYRIAVWWWELEQLPADWLGRGRDVDEVWAPTAFIADALRALGRPVFPMLPSVRLPAFAPRPKQHFGLSPGKFTFLFVFDMNSRLPRKNPLGLIRAFRRAFRPNEPVELVIKVSPQEKYFPGWWAELRAAARDNGVSLIDRSLSRDELLGLMNAADAYASLHRSEGFGLTMAEAMLLGKPTIATGYSGNLDFMTPTNSYLVRHDRAVIADDAPPYPKGCVWAEPSVEHAAELMRRVVDCPDEARAVAARGKAEAAAVLAPEAAGRRMATRLREIGRL
ncbi:MAG: glycosyltransferase, partial [Gemmataceae bacterium]|nr:glycosyltransferase [Gemmataceae bacterium]